MNRIQLAYLCGLMFLSGCTSFSSDNTVEETQIELLNKFHASLIKTISTQSSVDTVSLSSDSINLEQELYFLSIFEGLNHLQYQIDTIYNPDSTISKRTFTSTSSRKKTISGDEIYSQKHTTFVFDISSTQTLQSTHQSLELIFKKYGDNESLLSEYFIKSSNEPSLGKPTSYSVHGIINFD